MASDRDKGGRFVPGAPSPNPGGRPKKQRGVDAAVQNALSEKITVTEQGKRKRRTKLDVAATQLVNKGAGGDLRAAKLLLDQARKAEQNAELARAGTPVMTRSDHEIAARVIARLTQFILKEKEQADDRPEA